MHRLKLYTLTSTSIRCISTNSYYKLYILLVVFNVIQFSNCIGGIFELRLHEFSNPGSLDVDGHCCILNNTLNGTRSTGTSYSMECGGPCYTKFGLCLKHYQVNIYHKAPCTFGEASTSDLFINKTINHVFMFPFNFRWSDSFSLILEAWYINSPQPDTPFTSKAGNETWTSLVARMGIQQSLKVGSEWHQCVWTGHKGQVSLTYEYRVTCHPHYYGDTCNKTCRVRHDNFGHYTCSDQGDPICLPGWTGSYCENPVCRPGCQSTCNIPDTCDCRNGWEGPYCSECVRYPGCKHGTCNKAWECNCKDGWGGLFCNHDLNYCTNHKPCKNGGSSSNTGQGSYTCSCPVGFIGADCETRAVGCNCRNGGTCSENGTATFGQCPEAWNGLICE